MLDPAKYKMVQIIMMMASLLIGLFFTGLVQAQTNKLITQNSAGKIEIGMTVAEVRKAVAPMTLARTSDGKGIALIAVKDSEKEVMSLYANEDDQAAPINENAKIENIFIGDESYQTADGVHAKMPLSDVETKYGKVIDIITGEIESREYARFDNQPRGLAFQVMGSITAGSYAEGQTTTAKYTTGAYISRIEVNLPRYDNGDSRSKFEAPMDFKIYLIADGDNVKNAIPNAALKNCASSLIAVNRTKEQTDLQLEAALVELLGTSGEIEENGLKLANYWRGGLNLKSLSLEKGVATIQITGKSSTSGICDDVRMQEQIEATAKQYPTIGKVKVFINGNPLFEDTTNSPNEGVKERIKFTEGSRIAIVSGAVVRGNRDTYIVTARADSIVNIKLTSLENNAVFRITDPNGSDLIGAREKDETTKWSRLFPVNGDYEIIVGGTRGNATYELTVQILD